VPTCICTLFRFLSQRVTKCRLFYYTVNLFCSSVLTAINKQADIHVPRLTRLSAMSSVLSTSGLNLNTTVECLPDSSKHSTTSPPFSVPKIFNLGNFSDFLRRCFDLSTVARFDLSASSLQTTFYHQQISRQSVSNHTISKIQTVQTPTAMHCCKKMCTRRTTWVSATFIWVGSARHVEWGPNHFPATFTPSISQVHIYCWVNRRVAYSCQTSVQTWDLLHRWPAC